MKLRMSGIKKYLNRLCRISRKEFLKMKLLKKLKNKFNENIPIILALSTFSPHKNFQTLYNAIKETDLRVIRIGVNYQKKERIHS